MAKLCGIMIGAQFLTDLLILLAIAVKLDVWLF